MFGRHLPQSGPKGAHRGPVEPSHVKRGQDFQHRNYHQSKHSSIVVILCSRGEIGIVSLSTPYAFHRQFDVLKEDSRVSHPRFVTKM